MAVQCPHCGQETDGTLPFCQFCGQRLTAESGSAATGLPSWLTRSANGSEPAGPVGQAGPDGPAIKSQLVARLVFVAPTALGQTTGREFTLDGSELRIGRAPSCEINLDGDPLVSRFHAVLRPREGGYAIDDLGSSNGTLVNEVEIHAETPLREGDEVTIGECRLRIANSYFEIDTSRMPEPAYVAPPAPAYDPPTGPMLAAPAAMEALNGFAVAPVAPVAVEERNGFAAAPVAVATEPAPPPPPTEPQPEELRDQAAQVAQLLASQARSAIHVADLYRTALEDARTRVTSALAQQPATEQVVYKDDLAGLRDLVGKVVENPQHLEYVTRLASSAQQIAVALDTLHRTAPYADLLAALSDLRQRLDEALR